MQFSISGPGGRPNERRDKYLDRVESTTMISFHPESCDNQFTFYSNCNGLGWKHLNATLYSHIHLLTNLRE